MRSGVHGLTVDQPSDLVPGNRDGRSRQAQKRNDSVTTVSTDDGDGEFPGVLLAGDLCGECGSTDNIESGDTEELAGVEDLVGLQHLSSDGNGGVDGVRDDKDVGLRAPLGNTSDQCRDDTGVLGEELISGHAGLAGETGGDHNDVTSLKGLLQSVIFGEVSGGDLRRRGRNCQPWK